MKKIKIVADDRIPFLRGVLDDVADVVYLPGAKTTAADVRNADALITRTRTICNKELLEGNQVKFIATATIGFDHIDQKDMSSLGIVWRNAPGCNAASVAQYVASSLVSFPGSRAGAVLGIIGVGNVGKLVAKVGSALGMRVLLNDPPRAEAEGNEGFSSLEEIQQQADFISLHVPLEYAGKYPTFKMLGKEFFAGVKPGVVFMNSSRGEAVDGEALKNALKSGRVSATVLDVWENEPDIDRELMALARFSTPHIAGYSTDGKANGTAMSVRSLTAFFGIPGFEDFFPQNVPQALNSDTILLDERMSDSEQIRRAVLHTYNIADDDWKLKSFTEQFEKLRGNYPIRREFTSYTVKGASSEAGKVLSALGFKVD